MSNNKPSLPLQQALDILAVNPINQANVDIHFSGVKIDSRQIVEGDIFIALRGVRIDSHRFIDAAITNGAVAVIVDEKFVKPNKNFSVPIISVPCPQVAFGQLAHLWRTKRFTAQVIAITGSNGKTTIKNMLKSILQTRYKTGSTYGNYNNELGLPITIFSLPLDCDYWILEMGARHIGDIDYLCRIAMPNITLISNIGDAHIGEFGSKEKQVQAKAEILAYGDISILDKDSAFYTPFKALCQKSKKSQVRTIAQNTCQPNTQVNINWDFIDGEAVFHLAKEHFRLKLNCQGKHNAHNAAWAVAVADYCGLGSEEIMTGLRATQPEHGRLQTIECTDYTIINDSYNASPESVEALLALTQSLTGQAIMVWGDMAELGTAKQMRQWHEKMAEKFNQHHLDWVLTYGDYARFTSLYGESLTTKTQYQHTYDFIEIKQRIEKIMTQWQQDDDTKNTPKYIYLKASNKMNFSQLTTLLS